MTAYGAGCIVRTQGETVFASLPRARVGDGVRIGATPGRYGTVAAVERSRVIVVPFGSLAGVAVGDCVSLDPGALALPLGTAVLGRAIDSAGAPLDGGAVFAAEFFRDADAAAPAPHERLSVCVPFQTGIRAIDSLLTVGRGARVGFFGAPGAGKTTLLETIVAGARGDAVVLALVGERGREAERWLARLDARTTIVCATSDRSAAERVRAAEVAMAQAQHLRNRGLHVVLVVDSLARYVAALRERCVALGEPVGRGGYPPSVWAALARYLERAGNAARGSITLLGTVLSDGDDERDPLCDAARSLLDGHIVLSSALGRAGHYPAIDVLASASRTMADVVDADQASDARAVRAALARLAETRDARELGLAAMDDGLARAVAAEPALLAYLRQSAPGGGRDGRDGLRRIAASLVPE